MSNLPEDTPTRRPLSSRFRIRLALLIYHDEQRRPRPPITLAGSSRPPPSPPLVLRSSTPIEPVGCPLRAMWRAIDERFHARARELAEDEFGIPRFLRRHH